MVDPMIFYFLYIVFCIRVEKYITHFYQTEVSKKLDLKYFARGALLRTFPCSQYLVIRRYFILESDLNQVFVRFKYDISYFFLITSSWFF